MVGCEWAVEGLEQGLQHGRQQGRVEEASALLIRIGTKKFGTPPSAEERAKIQLITDRDRLEQLTDQVFEVADWNDLLGSE